MKLKAKEEVDVKDEPAKSDFTPVLGKHVVKTQKGFQEVNRKIARNTEFAKSHAGSKKKAKPAPPKPKNPKYFPAKFGSQHERVVAQREGRRQMLLATKGAKAK
jgi:hypothetical protein